MEAIRPRAVVLGAGISGLLVAKALAGRYRVRVLERDTLPEGPLPRKGVPQGQHLHNLLLDGYEKINELLPGWTRDSQLIFTDWGRDCRFLGAEGWYASSPSTVVTPFASRPYLEWLVRRAVLDDPHVEIVHESRIVGLQCAGDRVTHVTVESSGTQQRVAADLFVDCGGRASKSLEWLPGSFDQPAVLEQKPDLSYATAIVQLGFTPTWKQLFIAPKPPENYRGGVVSAIEGGRHVVTFSGYGEHGLPATGEPDDYLEIARGLRSPEIHAVLGEATFLSPFRLYKGATNRRLVFSAVRRWPTNFLLAGDALACVNPFFGQGMSVAAAQAMVLRRELARRSSVDLETQRRLERSVDRAWTIALSARAPGTSATQPSGRKRLSSRARRLWSRTLATLATESPTVRDMLLVRMHLRRSMGSLLSPANAAIVLAAAAKSALGRAGCTAATRPAHGPAEWGAPPPDPCEEKTA